LPLAGLRAARLLLLMLCAITIVGIYPVLGKTLQRRILQRWSLGLLHALNVNWQVEPRRFPAGRGCLFVANHISWLDVFAMNAAVPARFIAKSEVGKWPLVGWLSRRTGTLFICRHMLRDAARVNRQVAGLLQQGECIALFPEGTSTDGSRQVNFNAAMLQGAIDANAAIHPVVVYYHDGNGQRLDDAAFIGAMSLMQSLRRILSSPSLHVTIAILPAISSAEKSRRALAREAQDAVNATLDRFSSTAFMADRAAIDTTIHQSLTCSSCCGNIPALNSLHDQSGGEDAEPAPATAAIT
jgi:1-acyl-sn-glycerol-3-phosphate acyltransferase